MIFQRTLQFSETTGVIPNAAFDELVQMEKKEKDARMIVNRKGRVDVNGILIRCCQRNIQDSSIGSENFLRAGWKSFNVAFIVLSAKLFLLRMTLTVESAGFETTVSHGLLFGTSLSKKRRTIKDLNSKR